MPILWAVVILIVGFIALFFLNENKKTKNGGLLIMEITFPRDKNKMLIIGIARALDDEGNETAFDGVVFNSSDPTVFEIHDNTDESGNIIPNSCQVWPTGKAGASVINAEVDPILGPEVGDLHGEFTATFPAGQAVSFEFSGLDSFVDKPAASAPPADTGTPTDTPPADTPPADNTGGDTPAT